MTARGKGLAVAPYLFLIPALALTASFLWALWGLVHESLTDPAGGVSFENYRRMLAVPEYRAPIVTSLRLAVITTLVTAALAYPVALHMRRMAPGARLAVQSMLVLVFFSDYLLRMFGLIILLGRRGLLNSLLMWTGLTDSPFRLMHNELGVLVGLVSGALPLMIFALDAALGRIDRSTEQAAALLGGSPLRVFWHVTLPLSVPGLVAGIVLVLLVTVNAMVAPALLGGGFVVMISNFVYDRAIGLDERSLATAAAVIVFAVVVLIILAVHAVLDRFALRFGVTDRGRG